MNAARHASSWVASLAVASAGCGLLLNADSDTARPAVDGATPPPEGGTVDGSSVDAAIRPDATPIDPDASVPDATAPDASGTPIEHTVFISSTTSTGNLGGLAGADARCQDLAVEGGYEGTYMAILSDGVTSARDRLGLRGPISLMDGTAVAVDPTDLWDGSILTPIDLADDGSRIVGAIAWSGTDPDGIADRGGGFCGDWSDASSAGVSAEAGRTDAADFRWISIYGPAGLSAHACSNPSHLYCIRVR